MIKRNNKVALSLILLVTSSNLFATDLNQSSTPPDFPDYKLEQITKLIQASDIHRSENRQKEFNKKLRKDMKTYNSYAKPKFLTKEISKSSLPHAKKVQKVNDTFVSKSDKYNTTIPLTPTGDIILKEIMPKAKARFKKSIYNLRVSLPNKESSTFTGHAKVGKDNTVIYKDYQENTDVAVQALSGSVRILTILNDANAPTEYTYDINIPTDGHMKKLEDGSITILDKNKNFLGGFAPAWAVDKNGKKVPTHYEIRGNTLVQIVEHLSLNVTYPIVADPNFGINMIRKAKWRRWPKAGNGWYDYRLYVTPTAWARGIHAKWYGGEGWKQLTRKVSYLTNNRATTAMRNQYLCHLYFGWLQAKTEYHLEQWSPSTSWWNTLRHGCNVPGHI